MITGAAPIVTRRLEFDDHAHTISRYLETGGYEGLRKALTMTPEAVAEEVNKASLLGRGGAGFPAGRKWSMLRAAKTSYLVVNGDESEPATFKDHLLTERDPHQILEGSLICTYAIGASQIFIFCRGEFALGLERLQQACNEAYEHGAIGQDIFGSGFSIDLVIHPGAGAYICGEETALLESLEGKRGFPRIKPPFFPAVDGLYGAPTVVNNIETMSNLPWIVLNGGDAFAALGQGSSTGTRLFALSGRVNRPGWFELEMSKTTFRDLIFDPSLGAGVKDGKALKAFIPGGVSAPWFGPDELDLGLDQDAVGKAGSMLGSGSVVVMDETTCVVRAAWRITRFFARESCGQCTPCREGGNWLEQILRRLEEGGGREVDLDLLMDVCDNIAPGVSWPPQQTTICVLGPSIPSSIASGIRMFRDEFLLPAHERGRLSDGWCAMTEVSSVEADGAPKTVGITVDGVPVAALAGELIIEAAERAGVFIPRFCYHPRMEPVGMCRMCLVEVSSPRGFSLQPACFLRVNEGQEILTTTAKARKAQEGVLEFLLVNHPLDCPVCDKGGECPLQDQAMSHGPGESRFVEEKRHWAKPIDIGPLVALDHERCIQCARCTRFAAEVAGEALIDFAFRGAEIEVAPFPLDPFSSYFAGNTVQICPVGALTAHPYRFKSRPWDLEQVETTCESCAVGCRTVAQSSAGQLVRYLGVDVDPVNRSWLCDKGRYGFESVHAANRLTTPLVSDGGSQRQATWHEALDATVTAISSAVAAKGPESVGLIGGSRLSNEDAYTFAKFAKAVIGTDSVDCQLDDGLPAELVLGLPRATIDEACAAKAVLLLAPDLREELPVLFLRLRDAVVNHGVALVECAPVSTAMSNFSTRVTYLPGDAARAVALVTSRTEHDQSGFDADEVGAAKAALAAAGIGAADSANSGDGLVVVLGRPSGAESAATIASAATALAAGFPGVKFLTALRRANVHGALDMGLAPGILPGRVSLDAGRSAFAATWGSVPEAPGRDTAAMLTAAIAGEIDVLVLVGADPLADVPDRRLATEAIAKVPFVVAIGTHPDRSTAAADVVLPVAGAAERSGTMTNLEGRVAPVAQKVVPPGTAWPAWVVAAELAQRLGGDLGFDNEGSILAEIERNAAAYRGLGPTTFHGGRNLDGVVVPLVATPVGISAPAVVRPIDPMATPGITSVDEQGAPIRVGAALPPGGTADGGIDATLSVLLSPPAAGAPVVAPKLDAYSYRLVAPRRLYDQGTLVQSSPSLAPLATKRVLSVHPAELARLGVGDGAELRVKSARGDLVVEVVADGRIQRGVVVLPALSETDGVGAFSLIDAGALATDVRLETI